MFYCAWVDEAVVGGAVMRGGEPAESDATGLDPSEWTAYAMGMKPPAGDAPHAFRSRR